MSFINVINNKFTIFGNKIFSIFPRGFSFLFMKNPGMNFYVDFIARGSANIQIKEGNENVYVLTVTSVSAQYEVDGDYADVVLEAVLPSYWTEGETEQIVSGEKVSKKLNEADYFTITVSVDDTYKTWTYSM